MIQEIQSKWLMCVISYQTPQHWTAVCNSNRILLFWKMITVTYFIFCLYNSEFSSRNTALMLENNYQMWRRQPLAITFLPPKFQKSSWWMSDEQSRVQRGSQAHVHHSPVVARQNLCTWSRNAAFCGCFSTCGYYSVRLYPMHLPGFYVCGFWDWLNTTEKLLPLCESFASFSVQPTQHKI